MVSLPVHNLRYGRTVSYGSSFPPLFLWPARFATWAIRRGKNSVHNLRYGMRTRLIRAMYLPLMLFYHFTIIHCFRDSIPFSPSSLFCCCCFFLQLLVKLYNAMNGMVTRFSGTGMGQYSPYVRYVMDFL